MREIPFLICNCPHCGMRIYLREETDFHAVIKDGKEDHPEFYYTCPECGAVERHPECFLPTFLKVKLVKEAMQRKSLISYFCMIFVALMVGVLGFYFWVVC